MDGSYCCLSGLKRSDWTAYDSKSSSSFINVSTLTLKIYDIFRINSTEGFCRPFSILATKLCATSSISPSSVCENPCCLRRARSFSPNRFILDSRYLTQHTEYDKFQNLYVL